MKNILFVLICTFLSFGMNAQTLGLKNALVISQMDKQSDRFSIEVAVSEILSAEGVKNALALNLIKQGGDPQVLLTDSIKNGLTTKGIDTYMLISIRGYDKKFKVSNQKFELATDLATENLFPLWKDGIVSVTLEFHFYRNNQLVTTDLIKIGGANSREVVLKKLRKKLKKRIVKKWK